MRDETVARNYAETLFELGVRDERVEAYDEAIETVARLLDEASDFRAFLETPRIDAAEKKRVLRKAFEDALPRHVLHFVLITVDKRRQRLLRDIARQHHLLVDEHLGRIHVDVTVARPMDEAAKEEMTRRLSRLLGKDALPHVRVKPGILGGVVVRTGDVIYDGSLRRRLEDMRRQLLGARLPEPGMLDAEETAAGAS